MRLEDSSASKEAIKTLLKKSEEVWRTDPMEPKVFLRSRGLQEPSKSQVRAARVAGKDFILCILESEQ